MNEYEFEIPWGIRWSCQIITVFISLELRGKSESQVKDGSHQLLMGTEARRLDEIIWIEFCI